MCRPPSPPILAEAHREAQALHDALGGDEGMTAQRAAIVGDVVRVGIVLRAELARYLRTQDPDAAGRVGTLATVRRASLAAVGLDEHRVEHDLSTYLGGQRAPSQTAQDGAGDEIEAAPDPEIKGDDDRGATSESTTKEVGGPAGHDEGGES